MSDDIKWEDYTDPEKFLDEMEAKRRDGTIVPIERQVAFTVQQRVRHGISGDPATVVARAHQFVRNWNEYEKREGGMMMRFE